MNVEKYKIFLLLAENKKVSEIAKLLKMSQPTVSYHIKSLEKALDLQLFHVNKKAIALTDNGRRLLPYAMEMVELETNMLEKAAQYREFNYEEIYIGSTLAPGMKLLPSVIKSFNLLYPQIHFSIEIDAANEIIQNIVTKKYDIGLVANHNEIPDSLTSEILLEDPLILAIPPIHLERFRQAPYLYTLQEFNLIQHRHGSSTRRMVDQILEQNRISISSTISANSIEMIKRMIQNDMGISFLPYSLLENELAAGKIATIDLDVPFPSKQIKLIYPIVKYRPVHIESFLLHLRQIGDGLG